MGSNLVEETGFWIAGSHALAATTSLEEIVVRTKVETALGLIGVVAGNTGTLHECEDMIVPCDFRGRLSYSERALC